jgi:hypothetical protein
VAIAVLASVVSNAAQRPERQQELPLPGLGVVLQIGWQLILYHGCRFQVPEAWRQAASSGMLWAPDGTNMSIASVKFAKWSVHKAQVRAAFGRVRAVHEDSDRRLWLEIGTAERTQHYIDVPTDSGACIGILELPASSQLDTKSLETIATGIGQAPEHWSPAAK